MVQAARITPHAAGAPPPNPARRYGNPDKLGAYRTFLARPVTEPFIDNGGYPGAL